MTTEITVPSIETAIEESGLTGDGVASIRAGFEPFFTEFAELVVQAQKIGPDDAEAAREMRLALKRVRVAADKTRKDMKADSLRRGRAIDGANNMLLYALKPIETGMEDIEKAEERRIEAERRERLDRRTAAVETYADPSHYNLAGMEDREFSRLLAMLKEDHARQMREEAEARRKAEEERIAREKAEEERRQEEERIRKEQKAEIARLKAEKEEAERKAAAEREEAERKAAEERRAAEEKAAAERAAREKAEAEARRIREEAERKEREEAERRAREAAEEAERKRKAAAAPDAEKLQAMAAKVRAMGIPTITTCPGLAVQIAERVEALAAWLEQSAENL